MGNKTSDGYIVRNCLRRVPCYLILENVANNCITSPARKAKVAIIIMLALKQRSSLYCLLPIHFAIFSYLCRLNQFPRSIILWFPSVLNRHNISSTLTMAGMTVKIEVMMPACCRVKESLKTTIKIMNTKGAIYNNISKIILINNLVLYFSYLGLLPWILPYYNDLIDKSATKRKISV